MKATIHILLALIAVAITACSDDDYYHYGDFRYDMVTYMGRDKTSGSDIYINYPANDNPATTLIDPSASASASSSDIAVGDRGLLNYVVDSRNNYNSLNITVRGFTQAITDSLRYTHNIESLAMDSIRLNSIWRTGEYINMYCRVKYTDNVRLLALVMDYDTWHQDTVHCYMSHNMMGAQAYFWRRCYMSFNISSVWNLQSCRVVRVHLNDVTYPDHQYYDFIKTN